MGARAYGARGQVGAGQRACAKAGNHMCSHTLRPLPLRERTNPTTLNGAASFLTRPLESGDTAANSSSKTAAQATYGGASIAPIGPGPPNDREGGRHRGQRRGRGCRLSVCPSVCLTALSLCTPSSHIPNGNCPGPAPSCTLSRDLRLRFHHVQGFSISHLSCFAGGHDGPRKTNFPRPVLDGNGSFRKCTVGVFAPSNRSETILAYFSQEWVQTATF